MKELIIKYTQKRWIYYFSFLMRFFVCNQFKLIYRLQRKLVMEMNPINLIIKELLMINVFQVPIEYFM